MIKTFRGQLADGAQDQIRLSTIKGKVGYQIVKFQIIGQAPGTAEVEAIVKIWKTSQSTPNSQIDFTDSDLLAAAEHREFAASEDFSSPQVIIFDNAIFNQDIYISYKTAAGTMAMNYYIELEVIPLDDKAAEYAILKDIRTHRTSAI